MRNKYKYISGLLLFGLLSYFMWQINLEQAFDAVTHVSYHYVWLLLVSFLAYFVGTLAWKFCMATDRFSCWRLFYIRHIGEMLSAINPTSIIAGDGIKYFLLKDKTADQSDLLGSILMSRVLLILAFLFTSSFSLLGYIIYTGSDQLLALLISLVVFCLLLKFMMALVSTEYKLAQIYQTLSKSSFGTVFKKKWYQKILELNQSMSQYFHHHRIKFILAIFCSIAHWLLGALEYMLILYLLDFNITFFDALFIECGIVLLKNLLAFIPGQLGVEELGNKFLLQMINISDPSIWLSVSILRRTRQLFWILVGLLFYMLTFKNVNDENIIYNT